jgi:hypothetical protein
MHADPAARLCNTVHGSKWLAGAWIALALSTLATTAAMLGVGAAFSSAALPPDRTKIPGS